MDVINKELAELQAQFSKKNQSEKVAVFFSWIGINEQTYMYPESIASSGSYSPTKHNLIQTSRLKLILNPHMEQ